MQRKILALAAAGALGAAMTTGAMAAHMGGGGGGGGGHAMSMGGGHAMSMGGGHAMSMGGGHPMTMGTARMGTFAAPQGNFAGPRMAFAHPGMTGNRVVGTLGTPCHWHLGKPHLGWRQLGTPSSPPFLCRRVGSRPLPLQRLSV